MVSGEFPCVTIMIPAYNQQDYIKRAVISALSQDYVNLEVIVCDDNSLDRTWAIVNEIKDSRLKLYKNECNLGRVANYRHILYDLASGEWVVNLDGDDYYIDPSFISDAISQAKNFNMVVIISARCLTVTPSTASLKNIPRTNIYSGIKVLECLNQEDFRFKHMTTVYRKEAALKCGFYVNDVLSSDWESLYRLAATGNVLYVNNIAGIWNIHGQNESLSTKHELLIKNLTVWDSIFEYAVQHGMTINAAKLAKSNILKFVSYFNISSMIADGKPGSALKYLARLRRINPRIFFYLTLNIKIIGKLLLAIIFPKIVKRIL